MARPNPLRFPTKYHNTEEPLYQGCCRSLPCLLSLTALTICLCSACRPSAPKEHKTLTLYLNPIEGAYALTELDRKKPFDALILKVTIEEATNAVPLATGPSTGPITNSYTVRFRGETGSEESLCGCNVPSTELRAVTRLQVGKVYKFPDVLHYHDLNL